MHFYFKFPQEKPVFCMSVFSKNIVGFFGCKWTVSSRRTNHTPKDIFADHQKLLQLKSSASQAYLVQTIRNKFGEQHEHISKLHTSRDLSKDPLIIRAVDLW